MALIKVSNSGFSGTKGVTLADQWRLTSNITSNTDPIQSNLQRVDDTPFAKIGDGMSVSSGIWSFPTTGIYLILSTAKGFSSSSADTFKLLSYVTIDGGSNYDLMTETTLGSESSGGAGQSATTPIIVNVTDTSQVKIKFTTSSMNSGTEIEGENTHNKTSFTFLRLGDI